MTNPQSWQKAGAQINPVPYTDSVGPVSSYLPSVDPSHSESKTETEGPKSSQGNHHFPFDFP
jgi:hypothetical protein